MTPSTAIVEGSNGTAKGPLSAIEGLNVPSEGLDASFEASSTQFEGLNGTVEGSPHVSKRLRDLGGCLSWPHG